MSAELRKALEIGRGYVADAVNGIKLDSEKLRDCASEDLATIDAALASTPASSPPLIREENQEVGRVPPAPGSHPSGHAACGVDGAPRFDPSREASLQAIGDIIEYWIRWVTRTHEGEGRPVMPDTHIMFGYDGAPPTWPSVGQLSRWVEVLRGERAP